MVNQETDSRRSRDKELLKGIKQGELGCLHELFTRYQSHLITQAFQIHLNSKPNDVALDAANQTVIKVFEDVWKERRYFNPGDDVYLDLQRRVGVMSSKGKRSLIEKPSL
jgi:hypothetical protein